jgi:four helix bundle protein
MRIKSTSYRDLEVWKKAISLAKFIYEITARLPAKEIYGLSNQLQRSAVSIGANIAEGQARNSRKEFKYFLGISLGSLAELETLLTIACEINYISESTLEEVSRLTDEITRMIKGIIKHLSKEKQNPTG